MKDRTNKRSRAVLWIGIPILVLLSLSIAFAIFAGTCYHADTEAIEREFPAMRGISEQTLDSGDMVFTSMHAKVGLIFYPGGRVEHTAYIPLMRELAANGVCCVLCKMPLRLAVFDVHAADGLRERFPAVEHWYIGGHSLGGTIAASELHAHPDTYEGLILLASYAIDDCSTGTLRALSVFGSEDRVLNRSTYEKNRGNLPDDTEELVIDGGCHAFFGMYGLQNGDGTPAISNAEQIRTTARMIMDWLNGAQTDTP